MNSARLNLVLLLVTFSASLHAAPPLTREQVIAETMHPYTGESNPGVDPSTMTGKVLCGYQGWHAAEGDGLGRGWYHWQKNGGLKPGQCNFDLWPDLSGLGTNRIHTVIDDWKLLIDQMHITSDKAYLHHAGHPVVAVWGFGFNDGRKYTLAEGMELVRFLKDDPKYGGNTVMLGIPTYWRTLDHDAVRDPALHDLIQAADIVSPWTVGRYGDIPRVQSFAKDVMVPDLTWCKSHGKEYLPVVFPGFSWHNMNPKSKLDAIPRQGGKFLWAQYAAAKKAGATMVYQAMFDEVDEGTAIYKVTNRPPTGDSPFVTYEGLPSDHYLKLVGAATQMIAGKTALTEQMP